MPRIPRLPKTFPYRHLVMLFTTGVLIALVAILDSLLMESFPWIDLAWGIPIIFAAIVLAPLEVIGVGLIAVVLCLASQLVEESPFSPWSSVFVGIFSVVAALKARALRRYFSRLNVVRDAIEESPVAYAEFTFPGYKLLNHNQAFNNMTVNQARRGAGLLELMGESAAELAEQMDKSISLRKRITCDDFHITGSTDAGSFWSINLVPISPQGRGAPKSLALFAFDKTDEINRSRTREAALRISAAVMSSLSLSETIRVVLDNLAFIAGTNAAAMLLLEDDQWVGVAGYGVYDDATVKRLRFPYDDVPIAVAALESKEAIASENPRSDPRFTPDRLDAFSVKSSLVVPLVSSNRSIGVALLNQTDRSREFTDEQVKFATVIGSHAALAIENASIYENEHYIRKSLEAIEAISEAGLVSLDLEEVLIELVTRTQDVMQMDAAMILLADEKGEELVARAGAGNLSLPLAEIRTRVGEGLAGRAFKEGVPMKIDDVQSHREAQDMCPFAESSGVKSVLAVPLRISGKVAGILQIGSQRERAFSAREWGLIQVLADRASMAVQNSLLHEKTRKELARVALLRDVAAACASSPDLRKISARALQAIYEQMGCFRASIYYMDKERGGLVNLAFMGHAPKVMDQFLFSDLSRGTLLTRAILERRMITHEEVDLSNATESEGYILRQLDIGDNRRCTVPIIYKDEVVGGMALVWPDQRPFTPAAIETIMSIANQLAVAIHSCDPPGMIEPGQLHSEGEPGEIAVEKETEQATLAPDGEPAEETV